MVTVCTVVEWDPDAECPQFEAFFSGALPNAGPGAGLEGEGAATRDFTRRALGSAVLGESRNKIVLN